MGQMSKLNLNFCKKVMAAYANGDSTGRICLDFGISDHNIYSILKKYPKLAEKARSNRKKNRAKKKALMNKPKKSKKSNPPCPSKKMTPEERIKYLEAQLQKEQDKNKELENLLNIAKEELGKS